MRIVDEKEKFIQKYYALESELLKNLRARAVEKKCDHMMVSPSEAQTLQFLVQIHKSQKIVEIGCLFGLSCLKMAEALPEVGHIWTLEKSAENAEIAQSFFNVSKDKNKISLIRGDAATQLKDIEHEGPFDCVFIDANKAAYPKYLQWAYQNLRQGGMVICDNTFLGGSVWGASTSWGSTTQTEAMLHAHQDLANTKKWQAHTLPSSDGLTVGLKL